MSLALPSHAEDVKHWQWEQFEPFYAELQTRTLSADGVQQWLKDWSQLSNLLSEVFARARLANTQNTADEEAEAYLKNLLVTIFPPMSKAENALNKKLLESGFQPDGFEVPLKNIRADFDLFREENLELLTRTQALGMEYGKITGAQTVTWNGEEVTLQELQKVYEDQDRATRERAYRLSVDAWLKNREAINDVWMKLFQARQQIAANAGMNNFREYVWMQRKRFDYTPDDCATFHNAIEQVVVPAAQRILEKRRTALGYDTLRPWDLSVDPEGRPPLRPYETLDEFEEKAEMIFRRVDPRIGDYFATMRRERLLDLPNRKNKRVGAYCTRFATAQRPFIFMNAVGTQGDIRTLLHEAGHAFHGFEVVRLPYAQQQGYPIEFAEVASMSMELLAAPYLTQDEGGFFSPEEAARDRILHLEKIVLFWPYMAVVDAFQQWAYTHNDAALNPAECDAAWGELWTRFQPGVDYTGLEDYRVTGWHRKQHIFLYPFYYVDYGLAQLGAVQVWANALQDQAKAVEQYLHGLSLGYTASLPQLYAATGATFAFDVDTMGKAVELIEGTISDLERQLA
ncbi:MAG: M3 family oligoendopeptidase [bacterium]|nr:M3 family oligoendopeptidase [bacterium]